MMKQICMLVLAWLVAGVVGATDTTDDEALWTSLKSGGYIVFLRHAVTESGIGDPASFRLDDCRTQRNLSAQGRRDAKRIGDAFRARRIPIGEVLSSRWCRCLETARLAFQRETPAPMLDSMFNEPESAREEKARAVLASATRFNGPGNLILVTHAQNIHRLTGVSPVSGEIIVTTYAKPEGLEVIGRLMVPTD
jgi:phosphohistidine phosphatase SixA